MANKYNSIQHNTEKETIRNIIAACPKLSAPMYIPVRHNKVATIIPEGITQKNDIDNRMIPLYRRFC